MLLVLRLGALIYLFSFWTSSSASIPVATYARIDYDVVYVRCPRAKEPVIRPDGRNTPLLNWNGVNDIWLSATNNVYQEPGCDLVLHHSKLGYKGLPLGDRGREEVLEDCNNNSCTVADPNVSLDGRYIVYTKWDNTAKIMSDNGGINGDGGYGYTGASQAFMIINPKGPVYAEHSGGSVKPYDSPASLWLYDLQTHTTKRLTTPINQPIPTMDTGGFFIDDNTIGFTSNREHGDYQFQLYRIRMDGSNLELLGHRAIANQLHGWMLMDGRLGYSAGDEILQKVANNQMSLFTINPDGSNPFILAGKHDSTMFVYHFSTQLSDGDIVSTIYYNHNNSGGGAFLRFPSHNDGPDFVNLQGAGLQNLVPFEGQWQKGTSLMPFAKPGQYVLTPFANHGDSQQALLPPSKYWIHPGDNHPVTQGSRVLHPSGAPDNGLLATVSIGGSSTMNNPCFKTLKCTKSMIGRDAGIWLFKLKPHGKDIISAPTDGTIVVDYPDEQEIMPRAVVPYSRIYGIPVPAKMPAPKADIRIAKGEAAALTGAASLIDRETQSLNGTPWNPTDGGGVHSGRIYMNMMASGADLSFYTNNEIYGIRVLMPQAPVPNGLFGGTELWAGKQSNNIRILGEWPVRKNMTDSQGNRDTSFLIKVPANTPFMFQAIDKNGMGLNVETTSRSAGPGETQICGGCHVHTRTSQDPYKSVAYLHPKMLDDATGNAHLLEGDARNIYPNLPGIKDTRTFTVDWNDGISQIIQKRCASCHAEGKPAQVLTGLRLDGNKRTYDLLVNNRYKREDGVLISSKTKPGNGSTDIDARGTDRITPEYNGTRLSRWMSTNSARSSMLTWALYGKRLDGRSNLTGLGPKGAIIDAHGWDHPEIWPKVTEHLAYVAGMPESEKRLISRWIDIGAPLVDAHDDHQAPVVVLTLGVTPSKGCPPPPTNIPADLNNPVTDKSGAVHCNGGVIKSLTIGLWDDSPIDYSHLTIMLDGVLQPIASHKGDVVTVKFASAISASDAHNHTVEVTVSDSPDWSLSLSKRKGKNIRTVSRTLDTLL